MLDTGIPYQHLIDTPPDVLRAMLAIIDERNEADREASEKAKQEATRSQLRERLKSKVKGGVRR